MRLGVATAEVKKRILSMNRILLGWKRQVILPGEGWQNLWGVNI